MGSSYRVSRSVGQFGKITFTSPKGERKPYHSPLPREKWTLFSDERISLKISFSRKTVTYRPHDHVQSLDKWVVEKPGKNHLGETYWKYGWEKFSTTHVDSCRIQLNACFSNFQFQPCISHDSSMTMIICPRRNGFPRKHRRAPIV